MISFADLVKTDIEASQDARSIGGAIDEMRIGPVGGGNAASPFAEAHRLLKDVEGPRFIIALTDGVWYCQGGAIAEAKGCHADGIEIIAIGFGSADQGFLDQIANSAEGSIFARAGELVEKFGHIAQELARTSTRLSVGPAAETKSRSLRFFG